MYIAAGEFTKAVEILGENGWADKYVDAHGILLYYLPYFLKLKNSLPAYDVFFTTF